MAAYRRVDDLRSPAGRLPVHRDQLRAQRSVSSMESLYLYVYFSLLSITAVIVAVAGTNRYDMEASVTSPSGVTELCDIQDLGTSQYSIKFIPKEMGIHTVSVKHRGMHIPGLSRRTAVIYLLKQRVQASRNSARSFKRLRWLVS